jgi:hypothetical protein
MDGFQTHLTRLTNQPFTPPAGFDLTVFWRSHTGRHE